MLLSSLSTYYINDLNKSVLFITTTMCDVDDDDDRSVNDNDSGAKYQYSYCISYTQDQVVLDRQSLPVWMKNPSRGDKSKNCRMSNIVSFNILYF